MHAGLAVELSRICSLWIFQHCLECTTSCDRHYALRFGVSVSAWQQKHDMKNYLTYSVITKVNADICRILLPGSKFLGCCRGSACSRSSMTRVAPFKRQSPIKSIACPLIPQSELHIEMLMLLPSGVNLFACDLCTASLISTAKLVSTWHLLEASGRPPK